MRRSILLIAVLMGGCFKPAPKSFVAVVTAVSGSAGSESVTTIWAKKNIEAYALNLKTPSEVYFTVKFRMTSHFNFPSNVVGELRYHECGDDLYCFDSFTAKK